MLSSILSGVRPALPLQIRYLYLVMSSINYKASLCRDVEHKQVTVPSNMDPFLTLLVLHDSAGLSKHASYKPFLAGPDLPIDGTLPCIACRLRLMIL